ncbi:MAG: (4Fe-4S)-binding protein [Rikenellaceae bacterium]|jgi:uncharacterized Fe-S cluster protein YjdI|nr:(4Fe-4S)-binding protein [Rikenellaceae bacterium]
MSIVKKYSNGEITIIWEPEKCTHAGVCVRTLPKVYNVNERPWVKPQNATTEQLIEQIDRCPSKALTYERIV